MPPKLRALAQAHQRAIIYLRQSVAKDDSISIEMQEIACRDYCDRMGYVVVDVRSDPGISGRTWSKRPDVQIAMRTIEDGDADVIVLWKWSRLSRSRKDWALAIDRVDLVGGRIESATEPIDTATASGRFARGVMTEYAAFQSEQIGEVWEEVRQRRLKLGLPASGRLPYGWRWLKGEGIEAVDEQAAIVVEMYRRYLAGDGSAAIAQWLNTAGIGGPNGKPWTRARPLTVLDSPIHAGLIPYRGATYPGAHAGIIEPATFEAYQAERATRRETGAKPRNYDHLLSLLMRCECGARMHGKGSVTGGHWYGGYICGDTLNGHPQRAYVSAKTIEPAVVEWLMTFDPDVTISSRNDAAAKVARERILRELNGLESELSALTRQLAQGIVPEAAYLRARGEIEADSAKLRDDLRKHTNERTAPTAAELGTLRSAWPAMTTTAKNRALRQIVEQIELLGDGEARLTTTWGNPIPLTFDTPASNFRSKN
ncbi:recombinase family protein [Streptomyces albidoflavus]